MYKILPIGVISIFYIVVVFQDCFLLSKIERLYNVQKTIKFCLNAVIMIEAYPLLDS